MKKSEEGLERVRKRISTLSHVPEEYFQQLANVLHKKTFSKGEVILREGQICKHFYYILNGCMRSFSLKDGREVNVNFYLEDDIACDFASMRNETPSEFYIVAMEYCIVFQCSKAEAEKVFFGSRPLQMLLFRFFQNLYLREEEHSNSFKLLETEDRYKYMLEHDPELLQRIPMRHLASYLGISRETLSRIRRKIS